MSRNDAKRLEIFHKYSKQLNDLRDLGIYNIQLPYEKTYICPICFNHFSEDDLNTSNLNFLTLEDAPPKSLGGKANTLTCKKCNNEAGHQIDVHLIERLKELDVRSFLPNTGSRITITHEGIKVQGTLEVDENGVITITHLDKVNNPVALSDYISKTGVGEIRSIDFPVSRVDAKRLEVALLKTAYILAFEKYGYPLILSKSFDIIRQQLNNPDEDLYPSGFWARDTIFKAENSGVHLITSKGFEGWQAIFVLHTEAAEFGFGVYLPTSAKTLNQVVDRLKVQQAGFELRCESYAKTDYFNDSESQSMLVEFMKKREG